MKRLKDNFKSLIDCLKAGPDWFNRVAKLVNSVLNEMQVVGGELQTDSMGRINKLVLSPASATGIPVKCTSADDPEAGLHTFSQCDLDGVILTEDDEVIFEECRIWGDFDKDWVVSDTEDKETAGLLYIYDDQYVVELEIDTTPVPVKCTAEDTPSAGLHTFKECDLDGTILTGADEVVYTSCRLLGDEDGDWDVSVAVGEETFGYLYKYKGENVVSLHSGAGAYYVE